MNLYLLENDMYYIPYHKVLHFSPYRVSRSKPLIIPDYKLKDITLYDKSNKLIGNPKAAYIKRITLADLTIQYTNIDLLDLDPYHLHVLHVTQYQ